jgi:type II secretory pathway component PulF
MRRVWIIPVLLIMILPDFADLAAASDPSGTLALSCLPAWMRIDWPMLVLLGCCLVYLAGWRIKRRVKLKIKVSDVSRSI